jgi:hypothetical protein
VLATPFLLLSRAQHSPADEAHAVSPSPAAGDSVGDAVGDAPGDEQATDATTPPV